MNAHRLAIATSSALAAIDVYYSGLRKRISPVYLLDAVVELGMASAWAYAARRRDAFECTAPAEVVRDVW